VKALVTGAAREGGIGRAIVARLERDGMDVVTLDVAPGCTYEIDMVSGELPVLDDIDVLVCNAAVTTMFGAAHTMNMERWQKDLDVNLTGTFLAVRACLPHLLDAGGGSIVTVGSIASLVAGGYAACYDASKGAVLQFTRAIAAEYAHRGIRANCVCPGAVTTGLKATSAAVTGPPRGDHATWAEAPIGRHADPSELAAAVAFLCADESSFMTGSPVMVDGGFTAV
jgi:NAD(P)-dependent dehydrogenase (short-subunit alcohol dehydrogenase family)